MVRVIPESMIIDDSSNVSWRKPMRVQPRAWM